jgi:hypothetical protein
MSPTELVRLVSKLKELGAMPTRIVAGADTLDVSFSAPAKLVALPTAPERERERRDPEEAPPAGPEREAWRAGVLKSVTGG